MKYKRVLAVETSCDDTSVAIVKEDGLVEAMLSANQDDVHEPFGGVVPEIAGRSHSEKLIPLINKTLEQINYKWEDISGLVVTSRPGLVGSLIVGLVTVKTLAWTLQKNFIGINHIEGHIWAPFVFENEEEKVEIPSEFLSLIVSGGHTQLVHVTGVGQYKILGHTIDDAAGEAFDKFAKMMGLGYPGGYVIDQKAKLGNSNKYSFPRPMIRTSTLDFSFSGLKTAALKEISQLSMEEIKNITPDICASYQQAIVDVLVSKLKQAHEQFSNIPISVTGGVSANSLLRSEVAKWAHEKNLSYFFPKLKFCTDNAAMVGFAGIQKLKKGELSPQTLGPSPRSLPEDFSR
ncbi:MAG: tRNA (adenosine(37)-N6)-threonylcarbamoyltransferase complex transferase subunit TsaD [Bdellovibrionales bacterium]|nr:tRNA (adenosine(37)-N6)-threonylcarbamoyltransferase complex transferase subunit TsaD [Bdellovibrionales bacterium]